MARQPKQCSFCNERGHYANACPTAMDFTGPPPDNTSQAAIAKRLGVSRAWVQQTETRAMKKMREEFARGPMARFASFEDLFRDV